VSGFAPTTPTDLRSIPFPPCKKKRNNITHFPQIEHVEIYSKIRQQLIQKNGMGYKSLHEDGWSWHFSLSEAKRYVFTILYCCSVFYLGKEFLD